MNMNYMGMFDVTDGTIKGLFDLCATLRADGMEVLGIEVWVEREVKVYLFVKEWIVEWIETRNQD